MLGIFRKIKNMAEVYISVQMGIHIKGSSKMGGIMELEYSHISVENHTILAHFKMGKDMGMGYFKGLMGLSMKVHFQKGSNMVKE
jgi:hypothetical protein